MLIFLLDFHLLVLHSAFQPKTLTAEVPPLPAGRLRSRKFLLAIPLESNSASVFPLVFKTVQLVIFSTFHRRLSIGCDYSVCHLAELDEDHLKFYGPGSLEAVDRNWGEKAAFAVNLVSFNFINFDKIVPFLTKIKNRFVNVAVSYPYNLSYICFSFKLLSIHLCF